VNRSLFAFRLAATILAAGCGSLAGSPLESTRLTFLVYEYASVDPGTLRQALDQTVRILRQAGIETAWHLCTPIVPPPDDECERALGPTTLALKILPEAMARKFPGAWNSMGLAAQDPDGNFGVHAMVFFQRVEELAEHRICSRSALLAHAMAHEIGHLLLGTGGHSRAGIMKADWRHSELSLASRGELKFTSRQAAQMRSQLGLRSAAHRRRPAPE